MSFILFMDESGHDHKQMPYEVRGGIALHASRVWAFALQMRELEMASFGLHLHDYGSEIKGEKLLDSDKFRWAAQTNPKTGEPYEFTPEVRCKLVKEFFDRNEKNKERRKSGEVEESPGRLHFTAYGQACLYFAENAIRLLREQGAYLLATAIPRGVGKQPAGYNPSYLRKDLVFLLERYFYLLEEEDETGLLVMDQIEKTNDRRFGQRIGDYFLRSHTGRIRSTRIVPVPLFVTQDISYALQAADLCIYIINWGFRLPLRGMNAPSRQDVASAFGWMLGELQWRGKVKREEGDVESYGIVYVPDPFTTRPDSQKREGGNAHDRSH